MISVWQVWGAGLWFWFAFLWWLAMSSIFSFACCHLHIFFGKCLLRSSAHFLIRLFFCFLFFWYWIVWAVYVFWMLICYCSYYLQLFSPRSLSFHFVNGFFCSAKTFNYVRFIYFCFCFVCLRRQIQKTPLLQFMSKSVLTIFSSEILWFYILHLGF